MKIKPYTMLLMMMTGWLSNESCIPASFRRHSLLDSESIPSQLSVYCESIPSQLSVYCESIPSLRRLKTHIRTYGTSTYGAMHGLKIRVSAVQVRGTT